jgi:hypothetical protein
MGILRGDGETRIAQKAECQFPIANSLASGMLFCTEPGPGKFLSTIARESTCGDAEIAGIREEEVCRQSGEEAGAQWEMLPEGRRPDGPIQVRRSMTKARNVSIRIFRYHGI